jgi:hypothetical protein
MDSTLKASTRVVEFPKIPWISHFFVESMNGQSGSETMPLFEASRFPVRAIALTWKSLELIIMDDGYTDDSP